MKKTGFLRRLLFISFLVLSVGLFGCEGDDGDRGPVGPPGPPGPPGTGALTAESCDICHGPGAFVDVAEEHMVAGAVPREESIAAQQVFEIDITGVTIPTAGVIQPVVTFTITNLDTGMPVTGLTGGANFIVSKLVPGTGGDASGDWLSYVNRTEDSVVQATTENNGIFAETATPGTYTYTFATDLATATDPVSGAVIGFDPNMTHRVGAQLTGDLEDDDDTFDVVPSGGALATRDIAVTESCNDCHLRLALHGNGRYSVPYCVTCHNPGTTDAQSGNTVDFKVMIHKIHRGEGLPSVEAGGRYFITGFGNNEHDYSTVVWPAFPIGDPIDCTACHYGGNFATKPNVDTTVTADGDLWATNPTIEACGSCHDDVNFATGENHVGGAQANNANCTICHPATGTHAGFIAPVATVHNIFQLQAAQDFQYNINSTSFDAASRTLTVNFSVTDPLPGGGVIDPAAGSNWNILTDTPFTTFAGGASRLAILVGWDPQEFHNTGSGAAPAQPISINPLANAPTPATDNGDGTFSVTATIPEGVDSVRVALEGHPAVTDTGDPETPVARIPVTNAFVNANTGADPTDRREVVDIDKCNFCHGTLSLHGNNRTDEIGVCVMCHNPNATDIEVRPATVDDDGDGVPDDFAATGVDDKREQPIDFKNMIHGIHAGGMNELDPAGDAHGFRNTGIVVYGFGRSVHDYAGVRWPAMWEGSFEEGLAQCLICHVDEGTIALPLADEVLATTVETGDPELSTQEEIEGALEDPADDLNITRTASACSSCHDSASARGHMIQNGANFEATQEEIDAVEQL